MKNTIKKAICTALATVSLSALVTFPPPPSNPLPKTEKGIVNILEANAAEKQIIQAKRLVKVKKQGNIRSGPGKNYTDLGDVLKGEIYPVFGETDKWVRISEDGVSPKKYVAKMYLDDNSSYTITTNLSVDTYSAPNSSNKPVGSIPMGITRKMYNVSFEHNPNGRINIWGATDSEPRLRKWVRLYNFKNNPNNPSFIDYHITSHEIENCIYMWCRHELLLK